jgi:hypothetical protein
MLLPHEVICSDLPRSFFQGVFSCSACNDWPECSQNQGVLKGNVCNVPEEKAHPLHLAIQASSLSIQVEAEVAKAHIAQSGQIIATDVLL